MPIANSLFFPVVFILYSCSSAKTVKNCEECNTVIAIRAINENNISEQLIDTLFCTSADSCLKNAEFMEVYNEALFVCLGKKPGIFVQQLARSYRKKFILKQLESPVIDTINIQKIIGELEKTAQKNTGTYNKILQALKLALKKYNN